MYRVILPDNTIQADTLPGIFEALKGVPDLAPGLYPFEAADPDGLTPNGAIIKHRDGRVSYHAGITP